MVVLEAFEKGQFVAVWRWCGYCWNLTQEKIQLSKALLNLGCGSFPQFAFPCGVDPNNVADDMYAAAPVQPEADSTPEPFRSPEPVSKPTTRLEAYEGLEPNSVVVYSFAPKYLKPQRYKVKFFQDGLSACTCKGAQYRGTCKHQEYGKNLAAKKVPLVREPVEINTIAAFGSLGNLYSVWYGDSCIGRLTVPNQEIALDRANKLADQYFSQSKCNSGAYSRI